MDTMAHSMQHGRLAAHTDLGLGSSAITERDALRPIYQRLRELAASAAGGLLVFLVGEAGMGKTYAARLFGEDLSHEGLPFYELSLAGRSSAEVGEVISAKSKPCLQRGRGMVLLDDYPASEECDLARQAHDLRRLVQAGILVVICLRPDAQQIVEEMSEAVVLGPESLLVREEAFADDPMGAELTEGLPGLYYPLQRDLAARRDPASAGSAYRAALRGLTVSCLRPELPIEDLELRCAMILLGRGTADELSSLVRWVDLEALSWQRAATPYFGIDELLRRFSCVGLSDDSFLAPLLPNIHDVCGEDDRMAFGAANLLALRGQWRRAVLVSGLCAPDNRVKFANQWGIECLCAGETSFVREALSEAARLSMDACSGIQSLSAALRLLESPAASLDENMLAEHAGPLGAPPADLSVRDKARIRRRLMLLQACRDLDRGMAPSASLACEEDDDELSCTLIAHITARTLLLEGKISQAYRAAVNDSHRLAADSLGAALLADDFEIASLLLGEEPGDGEQQAFAESRAFFARLGIERLALYRGTLEDTLAVLAGRQDDIEGIERAITCAERLGDGQTCAYLLVVAAVCDLRAARVARGHVRALQAVGLKAWTTNHLHQVAFLIDACAYLCQGDPKPLTTCANVLGATKLGKIAELLELATLPHPAGSCLPELGLKPDYDLMWLLNVVGNDLGEASEAFRSALPEPWTWASRRSVRRVDSFARSMQRSGKATRGRATMASELRAVPRAEPPIEIRVLGDMRVFVRGREVPTKQLGRRRSLALISCLASSPSHKMSRAVLVDNVWPEYGYSDAMQRLYETTSRIRTALGSKRLGMDPFRTIRGEGMLALNPEAVSVDVDDFERQSRRALAVREDEQAIEMAIRALDLYQGDLYVSPYDAQGLQSARRQELRDLYADVSLAAIRAALHEGRAALAGRLAHRAYEACDLREDVTLAYIESLKGIGRIQVAREVYRDFAKRLMELTGMLPSTSFRSSVASIFPKTIAPRRRGQPQRGEALVLAR